MSKTCTFEGCENSLRAKGLCAAHYQQARSGRELRPLVGRGNWTIRGDGPQHGTTNMYSNHKCRCDACRRAHNLACARRKRANVGLELPEGMSHGNKNSYQRGCRCDLCRRAHANYSAERGRAARSKRVGQLRETQQGLCACCKREPEKLVMDHIHGTDHIRGLLCHSCNTGIGKLGDNIEGLERALAYLKDSTPDFLA